MSHIFVKQSFIKGDDLRHIYDSVSWKSRLCCSNKAIARRSSEPEITCDCCDNNGCNATRGECVGLNKYPRNNRGSQEVAHEAPRLSAWARWTISLAPFVYADYSA